MCKRPPTHETTEGRQKQKARCNMNKNAIQKMMITAIACIALCGTTLAAPAPRGQKAPTRAPQVQKAHTPARAPQTAHKPAPAPHKAIVAKRRSVMLVCEK